jgi:hypothetical protein
VGVITPNVLRLRQASRIGVSEGKKHYKDILKISDEEN